MEKKISIFLIDETNNIKGEKIIKKPKSYNEFISSLKKEFPQLPTYYKILFQTKENDLKEINDDREYILADSVFFIKEINQNDLGKSIFSLNYNKLSESNQESLDERFKCFICSELIKNEDPPFCYICQKNYHYSCLKKWEETNNSLDKILSCPNCRNELALNEWKKRLNFEELRQNEANMMNEIKKYKDRNDIFQKIMNIKELEKLESDETNIEEKFDVFKKLTSNLLKNILIHLNEISSLINFQVNKKISQLIYKLVSNQLSPPIHDVYNIIIEEFETLKKFIQNKLYFNKDYNNKIEISNSYPKKNDNKNEINLLYHTSQKGKDKIFGKTFVENNKNNIDLIINGNKELLIDEYFLNEGNNYIKLIMKNKLNKIEEMFYGCTTLKNIDDLKYLDTSEITDFSHIFFGCSSLENINSLENWDVSNGTNFQGMFAECSSLIDIEPLKKWKVFKNTNFKSMFYNCKLLSNLTPLNDWNVYKTVNFSYMFSGCCSLKDLKGLEFWNVSNGKNFESMFSDCKLLSNIEAIQNWNLSKSKNFCFMFKNCSSLCNIKPLNNWKIQCGKNLTLMFENCSESLDLNTLKDWEQMPSKYNLNKMLEDLFE